MTPTASRQGLHLNRLACAACALASIVAAGCGPSPVQRFEAFDDQRLFTLMENACLNQQWALAESVIREYLLRKPGAPEAHFYRGYRYLHSPRPWFGVALGEFETALEIYLQNGRVNPIPRFEDGPDRYFEIICYLEMSKVFLKQLQFLIEADAPKHVFPPILERCRQAIERVREIDPNSPDVRTFDQILRDAQQLINSRESNAPPVRLESI